METAKRIDDAISFLKNSTHEIKEGRIISLDSFQDQVRSICDELASVPAEEKTSYADKLASLAEILRNFEADLRARQAEINFELMSLNAKQKALKSYTTANHSIKKPEENGS